MPFAPWVALVGSHYWPLFSLCCFVLYFAFGFHLKQGQTLDIKALVRVV